MPPKPPASRYRLPEDLPLERLAIGIEPPEPMRDVFDQHNAAVAGLAKSFAEDTARPELDRLHVQLADLVDERSCRQACILSTLQQAVQLATDGQQLCRDAAVAWKIEETARKTGLEKVIASTMKALAKTFRNDAEQRLRARCNESADVTEHRESIRQAAAHTGPPTGKSTGSPAWLKGSLKN